jgi:hypothetical protein
MGSKDYSTRINALNQALTRGELQLTEQCPMTAIAFQQYRWASIQLSRDTDGQEKPRKKDDHLVDASQYLATLFYANKPPTEPVPKKHDLNSEIWDQVSKQVRKQRQMLRHR